MVVGMFVLLAMVGALAILFLIALALLSKRPGIVAGVAVLVFVSLLTAVGLVYSWVGMRHSGPPEQMWAEPHLQVWNHAVEHEFSAVPTHAAPAAWRISFIGLFVLAGAIAALVFWLRKPAGDSQFGVHRRWWPASLLLLLLPLFLFVGSVRIQRSERSYTAAHERQVHAIQQDIEHQQAELAHRASAVANEVQQQIARMNIHELMDKFDAPRIALASSSNEEPDSNQEPGSNGEPSSNGEVSSNNDEAELLAESEAGVNAITAESGERRVGGSASAAQGRATAASAARKSGAARPNASTEGRPQWVDEMPKRVGNTQREIIVTEEYASEKECRLAADVYLMLATYNHIQELTGNISLDSEYPSLTFQRDEVVIGARTYPTTAFDSRLDALRKMGVGIRYVRREIAKDEYLETVDRSFGPMKKLYTLVEFSPAVDRELRARWEAGQRQERFAVVGFGAGSVLGLLGLAWGLLKVDTWTKGYYTKRLFLGVPAAIISLVTLLALAVS